MVALLTDGNATTASVPPRETGQAAPAYDSAAQAAAATAAPAVQAARAAAAATPEGSHIHSTHEEGVADLSWSTGDAEALYPTAEDDQASPPATAPQHDPARVHTQPASPAAGAAAAAAAVAAAAPAAQADTTAALPAAAAAAATGSQDAPAVRRPSVTMIADAAMQSGDMVGGKAVLHIVDKVLISPALSREVGLPPSPGYAALDAPPQRANSNSAQRAPAGLAARVLPLVAAAAALLVLL